MNKNYYLLTFRKKMLLLLILSIYSTLSNSQEKDDLIIWSTKHKLSWNDFTGEPNYKRRASAISFLEINNIIAYSNSEIYSYTIIPVFVKSKSSVKNKNQNLLEHEQIHFDIQEIFARKIRKHFQLLKKINACDYTYSDIYLKYGDSLFVYQNKYDLSTNYSSAQKNQEHWKEIAAKKLKKLDAFSVENLYGINEED